MSIPAINAAILFVDDVAPNVLLGKKILELANCQVDCFTDSREALHKFSENPNAYDLLITDQSMPNLTGLDLADKVLACRADLPIIMVSGNDDIVDETKARECGINFFLPKPLHINTLIATVQNALQGIASMEPRQKNNLQDNDSGRSATEIQPAEINAIREHLSSTYNMESDSIDIILAGAGKSLAAELEVIQGAVQLADMETLGTSFHTIKGILLNLGLNDLSNVALLAEKNAKAQKQFEYNASYEIIRKGVQQLTS